MNKTPFDQPSNSEDELLPEHRFDYYKKVKPNRFANRSGKPKLTVVVLDEDVAELVALRCGGEGAIASLIGRLASSLWCTASSGRSNSCFQPSPT